MSAPAPTATPATGPKKDDGKAPVVHAPKEKGKAVVKAVPSGDSVVLLIQDPKNPAAIPSEKEISLSHITAPRIGRKEAKDEPFAWASREFLRSKVIGKNVSYTVEYKNPNSNREYGNLLLGEENIVKTIVENGWAKVLQSASGKDPRGEQAELQALSTQAETEGKGIFSKEKANLEGSVRNVAQKIDYLDVFERFKGKNIQALIEQVRTGSTFRVIIVDDSKGKKLYCNVLLRLAGAQAPNIPFSNNPKEEAPQPEPFAKDAKLFSEVRLLNRYVNIVLKGLDHKGDSFTAKMTIGDKNVAEELIKIGLASFVEWSAPKEDIEKMRAFEEEAKHQRLRIWHKHAPAGAHVHRNNNPNEFNGKVREILNGMIAIVDKSNVPHTRKAVSLSSIIIPRLGGQGREDEPWAQEAREFLRTRAIGKKVHVTLDYTRQMPQTQEVRAFCSVNVDGKHNLALLLVENGLAKVVSHKADEKRSPAYEDLVVAERKAQQKNKGVHGKEVPVRRVNDLTSQAIGKTEDKKKAQEKVSKQYLPFLKRAGRQLAVIEYVHSASKFKVYIPKEGCLINLVLAGIKVPTRRGDQVEPFADEALDFVRDKIHQRDVEIEVDSQDKGGNYIGFIWLRKKNFATTLLEQGFASVVEFSASRTPFEREFVAAEEGAKNSKKKIWTNWTPEQEVAKKVETTEVESSLPRKEYLNVIVTEVVSISSFFVQVTGDEFSQLEPLMDRLQSYVASLPTPFHHGPLAVGDYVVAQFTDDVWYRAKILAQEGKEFHVFYIDYGNQEWVPQSLIRPIDKQLLLLPPQVKECALAFVVIPDELEEDYGREAAAVFRDLVFGKTMWANVESRDKTGKMFLSLGDPKSQVHVNAALVRAGLGLVEKRTERHLAPMIEKLKAEQEAARVSRAYMWQYGDIDLEEEDQERRRGRQGPRRGRGKK